MKWRLIGLLAIACLLPLAHQPLGFGQEAAKEEVAQLLESAKKQATANKFDEAAKTMKKVLALAPKNDLYLAMAGDYERQAGNFAAGLAYAQKAIAINDKVGPYYLLAAANAYGNQDIVRANEYVQIVLKKGAPVFGAGAVATAKSIAGLLSKTTYTLYWDLDPKKGRAVGGVVPVALPKGNLPYQSVKYKVSGAKSYRVVKSEANDVLNVVPQGQQPFQVTMHITVQPYSYKNRMADRKTGPVPASVRPYLGASLSINPASPKLAKVAAGLKSADSVRTVNNISTWMKKNIDYKLDSKVITELDFKTAEEIVERRHAECRGYAVLFTALCRAAGVPARPIWGFAMLPTGPASHNWVEVYLTGVGWVPVDPQTPETFGWLPTTHVRLFMDMRRSSKTNETQPQLNLLFMNGNKLKHEARVESPGSSSSPSP